MQALPRLFSLYLILEAQSSSLVSVFIILDVIGLRRTACAPGKKRGHAALKLSYYLELVVFIRNESSEIYVQLYVWGVSIPPRHRFAKYSSVSRGLIHSRLVLPDPKNKNLTSLNPLSAGSVISESDWFFIRATPASNWYSQEYRLLIISVLDEYRRLIIIYHAI